MLHNVGGIDHCIILVRDLDAAASSYAKLGFTVAPRGVHSAVMGTGNHCIMLEKDYFELLGILTPTERNERWRKVLEVREGLTAVALRGFDSAAGATEVAARGFPTTTPQFFGRPVLMADGSTTETRFSTFQIEQQPAPGLRMFACQHLTPEATWVPGLMDHANTATGLAAVEVLSQDPGMAAASTGKLLDQTPQPLADGSVLLPTGAAPLLFQTRAVLAKRYPGVELGGLVEEGPVALAFWVKDIAAAAKAVQAGGATPLPVQGGFVVAPAQANGALLVFRPAA